MSWIKRVFGGSTSSSADPVDAVFAKLDGFLTSDTEQNRAMPDIIRQRLERGSSCDMVEGACGEFGRSHKNPIPVNGPIGEVLYLSSLRTNDGKFLFAHRLGTIADIDVFEIVTSDGTQWDILFFDIYHPRKSRVAPDGFIFRSSRAYPIVSATNQFVSEFPNQMRNVISEWTKSTFGMPMASKEIRLSLEQSSFVRPEGFQALLDALPLDGRVPNLPDQRFILAYRHVKSQAATIEAVLKNQIGCGISDSIESTYFALASLSHLYLRYGPSNRNTDFADKFQKYIITDSVDANLSFGKSVSRYQIRYLEYRNLMNGMFPEDGGFSNHDMVTVMLHVTETLSGMSARPYMIKVATLSVILASMFQDSIDFAKGNLK